MSTSIPPLNGSDHSSVTVQPTDTESKMVKRSDSNLGRSSHPQLGELTSVANPGKLRLQADGALCEFSNAIMAEGDAEDVLETAWQTAVANPSDPSLHQAVIDAEAHFAKRTVGVAEAWRASTNAQLAADTEIRRWKGTL